MNPDFTIHGVVETGVYVDDLDKAEEFYGTILGLAVIAKEPGRHIFFRVGGSTVLLAFIPDTTLTGVTPHGAKGPGHFALGIETDALEAWKKHLLQHGIIIEDEVNWPRGGRSIYFRDPAGNCVELVTRGIWGLPSGW